MNFERDEDRHRTLRYIATKYIEKMVDSYKRMFGEKPPRKATSPLNAGDHPELDQSEFLDEEGIQRYHSLIGSLQWIITIGRMDVQVAVMTLSSFRASPCRGHLDRAKRIVGYIWQFQKACIRIHAGVPDFSMYPDPQYNWMNTVHYHHWENGCPSCGHESEMVAARTAVEQIIEHRTLLRYLGVPLYEKSYLFGDNESVGNGGSISTARLNKRHNFLSYHRVREAITAGYTTSSTLLGSTTLRAF